MRWPPPIDMLEDVIQAWRREGLDVDACLKVAAKIIKDWDYKRETEDDDSTADVFSRLKSHWDYQRRVPLKMKTLAEVLNPQPTTARVLSNLLQWIDDVDRQSVDPEVRAEDPSSAFERIFFQEPNWWLTELERRQPSTE